MKTETITTLIVASTLLTMIAWANPTSATSDDWQVRRLMDPTNRERSTENDGQVFIYDGLPEQVVNQAMNDQYGRIESMMFIRVKHTEPDGFEWEDDDCSD